MSWWRGVLRDYGLVLALAIPIFLVYKLVLAPSPASSGNAPAIILPDPSGEIWDLGTLESEVIVVNFWATWCQPCRAEIPEFAEFQEANKDVTILGVSVDAKLSGDALGRAASRLGINYPVLHDRREVVARRWGVTVFPTTFILNADHEIVDSKMGALDAETLSRMVDAAR